MPSPPRPSAEPERRYFGKVADATPQDTMLLTLGCGKFRFYDHDYGMLPNTPLPRLVSAPGGVVRPAVLWGKGGGGCGPGTIEEGQEGGRRGCGPGSNE